jgi:16S rRNA (guanine527-N7)-methyltransferase
MLEEAAAQVTALAQDWSRSVGSAEVQRICGFLGQLLEWNARINLTGARDMAELIGEHLPDSFALSKLTPSSASVVDVGAGGGLPAVPFALLRPDCRVAVVEPRAKRVAFLRAAVRALGMPQAFSVVHGRDDDLPSGGYDVAASRATFSASEWMQRAERLVVPGGRIVVFASARPEGSAALVSQDEVRYATRRAAPRWAGAYVPRGTGTDD